MAVLNVSSACSRLVASTTWFAEICAGVNTGVAGVVPVGATQTRPCEVVLVLKVTEVVH